MRIGLIINQYRSQNKMSMEKFAKRSGISTAYVEVLEKGIHPKTGKPVQPSIDVLKKIAVGMNINFKDLYNMLYEEENL